MAVVGLEDLLLRSKLALLMLMCDVVWWFERKQPSKGMAMLRGVALLEEACVPGGGGL